MNPDGSGQPWVLQPSPLQLLLNAGLAMKHISSMLSGSGAHLTKNLEALRVFTTPTYVEPGLNSDGSGQPWGLQPSPLQRLLNAGLVVENVSSILSGAGANLVAYMDKLITHVGLIDANNYKILKKILSLSDEHVSQALQFTKAMVSQVSYHEIRKIPKGRLVDFLREKDLDAAIQFIDQVPVEEMLDDLWRDDASTGSPSDLGVEKRSAPQGFDLAQGGLQPKGKYQRTGM